MKYNEKMFTLRKNKKHRKSDINILTLLFLESLQDVGKIMKNFHFSSFYTVVGKHLSCCYRHVAQ